MITPENSRLTVLSGKIRTFSKTVLPTSRDTPTLCNDDCVMVYHIASYTSVSGLKGRVLGRN